MLKRFLSGLAAVVCAGGIALGANLTLMSGPQDPSQLLATVNQLIQSINTGVSGRLSANTTATGVTTTAVAGAAMMSYTMPANTLAQTGDAVRVVCWGTTAATANAKSAVLYFGTSYFTTSYINSFTAPNNKNWRLELLVMRSGASAQKVLGNGIVDVSPTGTYVITGSDSLTANVVIKCQGINPTAAQDITAQGMLVEQVK